MINHDGAVGGIRIELHTNWQPSGLDENYQEFAAAIVKTAVKDYESVLLRLFARPTGMKRAELQAKKSELEVFFYSDWYALLSDIDGGKLIEAVRHHALERAKESIRKKHKKRLKDMEKCQITRQTALNGGAWYAPKTNSYAPMSGAFNQIL